MKTRKRAHTHANKHTHSASSGGLAAGPMLVSLLNMVPPNNPPPPTHTQARARAMNSCCAKAVCAHRLMGHANIRYDSEHLGWFVRRPYQFCWWPCRAASAICIYILAYELYIHTYIHIYIHRPMGPTCHHCKWYAASEYYAWPQIWVWGVFCCVIVVKVNVQVYGPEPL